MQPHSRPDSAAHEEARGLVDFLVAQKLPAGEVRARIHRDPTISADVRQRAVELADARFQAVLNQQVERLVASRFDKSAFKEDVLASLHADPSLSEPMRRAALSLAERWLMTPDQLNEASWNVVRAPGAGAEAYRKALAAAEAACRLRPGDLNVLNTLGIAQYRAGQYERAVATLLRCDGLRSRGAGESGTQPADLAFVTLAQYHLGQLVPARATLQRLRETMKQPLWANNPEARLFWREVLPTAMDLDFPGKPFAP